MHKKISKDDRVVYFEEFEELIHELFGIYMAWMRYYAGLKTRDANQDMEWARAHKISGSVNRLTAEMNFLRSCQPYDDAPQEKNV